MIHLNIKIQHETRAVKVTQSVHVVEAEGPAGVVAEVGGVGGGEGQPRLVEAGTLDTQSHLLTPHTVLLHLVGGQAGEHHHQHRQLQAPHAAGRCPTLRLEHCGARNVIGISLLSLRGLSCN